MLRRDVIPIILGGHFGARTNKHGLKFEFKTDLATHIANNHKLMRKYDITYHKNKYPKSEYINCHNPAYDIIDGKTHKLVGVVTKQLNFYNIMFDLFQIHKATVKSWKPDECFFNLRDNTVYIVEKKWQQVNGSNDEKIFGLVNKRQLYQKDFNQLKRKDLTRLGLRQKPLVEFCVLFNSSWWLDGKEETKRKGKIVRKHVDNLHYEDYFDILRDNGIRIFFDNYDYRWFDL